MAAEPTPDATISVSRFAPWESVGLVDERSGREHGPYTLTWNGVSVGQAVPADSGQYRALPCPSGRVRRASP